MSVCILVPVVDYLLIVINMESVNYTLMVLGLVLAIKLMPWHKGDVLGLLDPEYEGVMVLRKVDSCSPVKMT